MIRETGGHGHDKTISRGPNVAQAQSSSVTESKSLIAYQYPAKVSQVKLRRAGWKLGLEAW